MNSKQLARSTASYKTFFHRLENWTNQLLSVTEPICKKQTFGTIGNLTGRRMVKNLKEIKIVIDIIKELNIVGDNMKEELKQIEFKGMDIIELFNSCVIHRLRETHSVPVPNGMKYSTPQEGIWMVFFLLMYFPLLIPRQFLHFS